MGKQTYAVHPRHDQIENNERDRELLEFFYGFKAVAGRDYRKVIAESGQTLLQGNAQNLVVIDEENLSDHLPVLLAGWF
ncbi:MAG: hypothetical protein ACD_75C02478G0003 [uncultured bacterium]|nr:MAG: hypothetical protein ACD_75C02478G0003 [uncultured bacterium]